jgi:hypothetical protein
MTKNTWITALVVAIIFGGGGYYFGTQHASSAAPGGAAAFAGRTGGTGNAAGRFGAGASGGGFTTGTIISTGSGTMTIQLPSSTSTSATTGTKIVLSNTTVTEMKNVDPSTLAVGQDVVISGTANSDGSLTATSIQVRAARTGAPTGAGAPTSGQ